jgi:LPXTG-motif cell wall-anchored protein
VAQKTTDETGRVTFGGLPIRTYVLEETTPPTGHVRSDETVRFRMDTEVPDVFYQFADVKIRADVVILKTGVDDVPLSGAEFSLYDSNGALVSVKTTGADGKTTFEDLVYGSYTLVETKAPKGYVRAEDSTPIEVSSVDEIDLTISNARYVIPQTGGFIDTWALLIFGGALILGGVVWLVLRKRADARG